MKPPKNADLFCDACLTRIEEMLRLMDEPDWFIAVAAAGLCDRCEAKIDRILIEPAPGWMRDE